MDYITELGDANYWAIIVATLSTLPVGFFWYSMGMFGSKWARLVGLKKKDIENPKGMGRIFAFMLAGAFIAATMLTVLMQATGINGPVEGSILGFLIGIAFRATAQVMHVGYERKSLELAVINGMHDAVQLAVMGAIIGAWL